MIDQILLFVSVSALLTLSPGPDIIYVISQSMANGAKSGVVTALGLVSGIPVHTTLLAFGLAVLIRDHPTTFLAIKILGAIYLFYLAILTYRSSGSVQFSMEEKNQKGYLKLYKRGLIMNLINPKVVIFFLAFFPGFLWDLDGNIEGQFYLLGGVFMLQALLIFVLVSFFAASLSSSLRGNQKFEEIMRWIQILVFVGIGVYILI